MPGGDHTGPAGLGPRSGKCRGKANAQFDVVDDPDICICSECGYTEKHQRGIPCSQSKCPKCGHLMTRKRQNSKVNNNMKIAIASGKGGTGKTFVSVHLATALATQRTDVMLLDCDVEARNDHLFIKPKIKDEKDVILQVPEVNLDLCTHCGKCAEICEFNALAVLPKDVLVFQELCHACGGCTIACPTGAIKEVPRSTGQVFIGEADNLKFVSGNLNIGEAKSPPIIKTVQEQIDEKGIAIIDSPPGTSCPTVESVRDVDIVVLVAEPTLFGLYDLKLVMDMLDAIHKKYGVVINKDGIGNDLLEKYCLEHNIPILLKIPYNNDYNQNYAEGKLLTDDFPEMVENMNILFKQIKEIVS